jgi:hypothetical protein
MYHGRRRGLDARPVAYLPWRDVMSSQESKSPWHTDRWFTSPWNHDPEVSRQLDFPPKVRIHDATLRDGEQQAGVVFTADDKIRIAEALAEAGVHRIEAGLPAVSPADEAAIKEIVRRDLPSEIYAFSRCIIDDVKRAVDCGVAGVALEIPSSRHLIELGYRWTVERAIGASVEATAYAHEQGLKVSFFPIDATRASVEDYLDLVGSVARDGHLDALVLVDTFGTLTPQAVGRFVEVSRDRFHVPLETHFHMDYGMGVANSIIAAANARKYVEAGKIRALATVGRYGSKEVLSGMTMIPGVVIGFVLSKRSGEFLDAKYPILQDVNQHVTAIPEFFIIARR